jgi:hypothetical protein
VKACDKCNGTGELPDQDDSLIYRLKLRVMANDVIRAEDTDWTVPGMNTPSTARRGDYYCCSTGLRNWARPYLIEKRSQRVDLCFTMSAEAASGGSSDRRRTINYCYGRDVQEFLMDQVIAARGRRISRDQALRELPYIWLEYD